jgi:hypothetical protein
VADVLNGTDLIQQAYWLIPVLLAGRVAVIAIMGNSDYTANFVFSGLPYFFIGYFAAKHKNVIAKVDRFRLAMIVLISASVAVVLAEINVPSFIGEFFVIVYAVTIFAFSLVSPNSMQDSLIEMIGGVLYMDIFITFSDLVSCTVF